MPARTALLSFHLGPVQPFVAAAKTTRDLWAGSYLVSWLTAAALRPVLARGDTTVVSPAVAGNPLLAAYFAAHPEFTPDPKHLGRPTGNPLTPCLPNRFLARIPDEARDELVRLVKEAFDQEWAAIGTAVHTAIDRPLTGLNPPGAPAWDRHWQDQLAAPFEVRVVATPLPGRGPDDDLTRPDLERAGLLLEAVRMVRHVPPYYLPRDQDVPQKCTLLGTYEQMGPADLTASRRFWRDAANPSGRPADPGGRPGVTTAGAAVRAGERLCALSLVKRFAWRYAFAPKLGRDPDDLGFGDTATIAAREWLTDPAAPDREWWGKVERRSGQWLHWRTPNQDADEDPCPPGVWDRIQQYKRGRVPPPAYLGVVAVDADTVGSKWREDPTGVSTALTTFALERVRELVREHHGELVFTGGDDTLALCPAARAVPLAAALRAGFGDLLPGFTLSGGVAVVHHKEDLRFALDQARRAERAAKAAGRNRLTLAVCRRSGEHTTATMGWDATGPLAALVRLFAPPVAATDRWAYKLQADMATLEGVPAEVFRTELTRVIDRTDAADALRGVVLDLYAAFNRGRPVPAPGPFVTLCQSAAFLARGRDR